MNKKLTLKTSVFLWTDDNHGFLYDSSSHEFYKFLLSKSIAELCHNLLVPENLYSVFAGEYTGDIEVGKFIEEVLRRGFGILQDEDDFQYMVSFPPMLNLLHSWERIKKKKESLNTTVLHYFTSLTVYTGGVCPDNGYCEQTIYPVCSVCILSAENIIGFLSRVDSPYLSEINIVFSSIGDYPDIHRLFDWLGTRRKKITIYVRAEDAGNSDVVEEVIKNGFNAVLLHAGLVLTDSRIMKLSLRHVFLVTSDDNCKNAEDICKQDGITDFVCVPVFNGNNYEFFNDCVFLNEEEILRTRLSRHEIFTHQVININYFGRLFLFPDGNVFAGPGKCPVGNIHDTVYSLIISEMDKNTAWRKTRDMLARCKTCIYRYLCPSPSSYEEVMGIDCICTDKIKRKEVAMVPPESILSGIAIMHCRQ
ncbi:MULTISPECIES: hypothetical protein [unclassified Muribaculum]|uniref:hypothetical protein n=1 Tax=unclassified Muribaculum TaxID=2622126 RepID=UPI00117EE056|nr:MULTISPECIES: hypothetical protein [unclassified Muribaculum]